MDKNYAKKLENKIKKKDSFSGSYGCRGYDTFGPWKIIGGIAKKHPNQKDLKKAKEVIDRIIR